MAAAFRAALLRREIAFAPVEGVDLARVAQPEHLAELFEGYEAALRASNAVDFDDLLGLGCALLKHVPGVRDHYNATFKHILVRPCPISWNALACPVCKHILVRPACAFANACVPSL